MPIRFRCSSCNRLLGIATRKAGTQTMCPHCGQTITVPRPDADGAGRPDLDDVAELLGGSAPRASMAAATPVVEDKPRVEPPRQPAPAPPSAPVPVTKPGSPPVAQPASRPADEPPLFEGDVDAILGATPAPAEPAKPKPPATSGLDAMSLGEPTAQVTLSAQKATLLVVVVVILLGLAFAAGVFLSPRG
jgi:hypothetical protein